MRHHVIIGQKRIKQESERSGIEDRHNGRCSRCICEPSTSFFIFFFFFFTCTNNYLLIDEKKKRIRTTPTVLRAQNHLVTPNNDERGSKGVSVSSHRYFHILDSANVFTAYVRYCLGQERVFLVVPSICILLQNIKYFFI